MGSLYNSVTRAGRWGVTAVALTLTLAGLYDAHAQPVVENKAGIEPSDFTVQTWTTADGLPVNYIFDITQTRDGYLWLATGGGLVRFDGITFKVFTRADFPGWTVDSVRQLFEDREGALWIVSMLGEMARLHQGHIQTFSKVMSGQEQSVRQWYEDDAGALWIVSSNGLYRYHEEKLTVYSQHEGLPSRDVLGVFEEAENQHHTLSVITSRRLARFEEGRFKEYGPEFIGHPYFGARSGNWVILDSSIVRISDGQFSFYTADDGLPLGKINHLLEDPQGRIWIGTTQGVARWQDGIFTTYTTTEGLPDNDVEEIYAREGATVWIKTRAGDLAIYREGRFKTLTRGPFFASDLGKSHDDGLWLLTEDDLKFVHRAGRFKPFDVNAYLPAQSIILTYQDLEGNLWIGTDAGLMRLTARKVTAYTTHHGLTEEFLFPILEDQEGAMWLGTWGGGLNRLYQGSITAFTTEDGLSSNLIRSLFQDQSGRLWIGTRMGLDQLYQGRIRTLFKGGNMVRALTADHEGHLWFGGQSLLSQLRGDTLIHYQNQDFFGDPIANTVRAIHEDRQHQIWVASVLGLFCKDGPTWRTYTTADGLSSNFIASIHEASDGVLWFGTYGGLSRFKDGTFFTYTVEDGLYHDIVWKILEDDRGFFWMSSDKGIFRVLKQELDDFAEGKIDRIHSVAYTEADGMPSAEANGAQPAGWKARDGRLWFPTLGGAAVIDPNNMPFNDRPPPIHIQEVIVNGQPIDPHEPPVFEPGSRNLEFHFAALSFVKPERNQYRYKLEGYDADWVEAGTRRTAYYTNIPPGDYTFRVLAANNDGVWNEAGASFTLHLSPFFYQTFGFRSLLVLFIAFLAYGGYRYRLRRVREVELKQQVEERTRQLRAEKKKTEEALTVIKAHEEQLMEMDRIKSRFFANISHEFRTPLTLILGPVQDLIAGKRGTVDAEAKADLGGVARSARRMERLIDQLLDLARLEAGQMALDLRRGDLVGFVREIVRAHTPLAERNRIVLRFHAGLDALVCSFDAEKLEKVVGNLLSNALKFTPEHGKVHVTVTDDETEVSIAVRDTGPGISEAELSRIFDRFYQVDGSMKRPYEGTGIGLSLAKELMKRHGGTITVTSEVGFGSRFVIHLPKRSGGEGKDEGTWAVNGDVRTNGSAGKREAGLVVLKKNEQVETPPLPSPTEDQPTVLVVEDNAEVRAYLYRHLADEYRVQEASNGVEAYDQIRQSPPDLVVCDVMMPEMDGYELCRTLKADEHLSAIPIILLTAKAGTSDEVEGLDAGADDYISKPFDIDALQARIRSLIERRRALRQRFSREIVVQPTGVSITSREEAFVEKASAVVEAHMGESTFSVEAFAQEVGLSRSQLTRRMKAASGFTPAAFIRHLRLERAAQLLAKRAGTVSEVAYRVGFNDADHFSRLFREHFGVSPSQFSADEG